MTDQSNSDLIAEAARMLGEPVGNQQNWRGIVALLADALEAAEQRAEEAERERDRLDEAFDRDLPWRYDEVEAQRNQYAAVVEKVLDPIHRLTVAYLAVPCDVNAFNNDAVIRAVQNIVYGHLDDLAPADALREVKAAAWDEGSETGFTHGMSYQAGNNSAMNYRNPYRKEQP